MIKGQDMAKQAIMATKPIGGDYQKVSSTANNSLTMIRNKLAQLNKVRDAREVQKQHAVASNPKIQEYSNQIEEKETEIMKLMTLVDMLQNSREQNIKEAGEAFDKEHPFKDEQAEIDMLKDAMEAMTGRKSRDINEYIKQVTKEHLNPSPYEMPSPYTLRGMTGDQSFTAGDLFDFDGDVEVDQKNLPF